MTANGLSLIARAGSRRLHGVRLARHASTGACLACAVLAPGAVAEAEAEPSGIDAIEEVVVVGTRRAGVAAIESASPVTVVSGDRLREQASSDLLDMLRDTVPAVAVNTQPIADGATIVRPPNVRNLAADHTLVLVNGKRRHRGAVIAWLVPKASEGAQGPDLSVIPAIAIQRVEVLADGASAQYGSDAVAGVINFALRDAAEGGSAEVRYGQTSAGDGKATAIALNRGVAVGDAGFLNVSLEYGESGETVRSVQRGDAAALAAAGNPWIRNPAQSWGSPDVAGNLKTFANFALPVTDTLTLYAFGSYASKETDGGFYYRNPNAREGVYTRGSHRLVGDLTGDGSGACPDDLDPEGRYYANGTFQTAAFQAAHPDCFLMNQFFPGGFTPRFGGYTRDHSVVGGVRGEFDNGLAWDLGVTTGLSDVDFFIYNTVNAALGPANPDDFHFDPGDYAQKETGINLDLTRTLQVPGLPADTHLAFGAEWRVEEFTIRGGEPASWERTFRHNGAPVDLQSQGFTAGTNGFPGFSPDTAGSWTRANAALYADVETALEAWTLGGAVRWEDHDDFGATTNGKLSMRRTLSDTLALRATLSTGFRVPTPGQSHAINATSKQGGHGADRALSIVSTIAPTSVVGQALGGVPLRPERSTNATLGLVHSSDSVTATADCFRIEVRDRLALSRDIELNRPDLGEARVRDDLIAQLEREGLTSARSWNYINYFTNDFTTLTSGCEASGQYGFEAAGGANTLAAAVSNTRTRVKRYTPGGPLDAPREVRDYETGLPSLRYRLSATHTRGRADASVRYQYHGDWFDSEEILDFSGYGSVDVAVRYTLTDTRTVTVGAENVLDNVPEQNPNAVTGLGNLYSQYAPAGFNGRFAFVKMVVDF